MSDSDAGKNEKQEEEAAEGNPDRVAQVLADYGSTKAEDVVSSSSCCLSDERLEELLGSPIRPPPVHRRSQSHQASSALLGGRPWQQRRPNANTKLKQQHHHHRRLTSLSEYLKVHAAEQLSDIRQTFQNELEDADSGRSFFMDMNMTRSLSVLPEDLSEFVQETAYLDRIREEGVEEEEEAREPLLIGAEPVEKVSPASVASGYLMLLVAVLAVSSNGTALHLLHGVPAPLKLYWRMTATALLLAGFAAKSVFWNKYRTDMELAQWMTFGMAVVAFVAHTMLLYTALEYTTIGNAVIYANSQALLLIIGKAFVGEPVTLVEGAGVATAFAGAMLYSRDSEVSADQDDDSAHTADSALLGDFLALLSAVAGVVYLTFAKAVRQHVSVTLFMFLVMFLGSWLVLLYLCVTGVPISLSRDPRTGLFGWMTTHDSHFLIMLHIAVVCNALGTMGFVRAMHFFDTIIIAVATLLEPMIASLIAHAFHVGLMPGPLGYFGNALVTLGTIAVVSSTKGGSVAH